MNVELNELIELVKTGGREFKSILGKGKRSVRAEAMKNIAYFPVILSPEIDKEELGEMLVALESEYTKFLKLVIGGSAIMDSPDIYGNLGVHTTTTQYTSIAMDESFDPSNWEERYREDFRPIEEIYSITPIGGATDASVLTERGTKGGKRKAYLDRGHSAGIKQQLRELLAMKSGTDRDRKQLDADRVALQQQSDNNDRLLKQKIGESQADFEKRRVKAEKEVAEKGKSLQEKFDKKVEEMERKSTKVSLENAKNLAAMEPTMFQVAIVVRTPGSTVPVTIERNLGVKAVPHIVQADELAYNISRAVKGENAFFNLIRWNSGEKKFWKDLVFRINDMRNTVALSKQSKKAQVWHSLYMMRYNNKAAALFQKQEILPSATIILTKNEVDSLKEVEGVDVMDRRHASKIMSSLGIMGLIVYDVLDETVHVFADEASMWIDYPLDHLLPNKHGRQVQDQLINLMSKGS